jgi:tRNA-Thr(GGU) m(6)t(6)A37 methyltransferase TsaA
MEKIGVNIKKPYLCRMEIQPIAHFESPLKSKFGIPRQSGLVDELTGRIVFEKAFRQPEAVRGLEDFDYLWLIWEFSGNRRGVGNDECGVRNLTVRPPRLGGNKRMGVFATRSPFRPNNLGLSCVKLERVEEDAKLGPVIYVRGADLMDGTPVYDIKPYVAYADAHPEARSGFVDETQWKPLHVEIPDKLAVKIPSQHLEALKATLAQDPRPAFHDDPERTYGMPFLNMDVRFRVKEDVLTVFDLAGAPKVASRLVDDDSVETQQ